MVRNIRRLAREGQHWETRYAYSYLSENADQVEWSAVLNGAAHLSNGTLDDVISETGDDMTQAAARFDDRLQGGEVINEALQGSIAEILQERSRLLGAAYPFQVGSNSIEYRTETLPVYALLLGICQAPSLTSGHYAELPRIFEDLSKIAGMAYLGPGTGGYRTGWPRPAELSHFKVAIADLKQQCGNYPVEWQWSPNEDLPDDPAPKFIKEAGLDVVVWRRWPDQRTGQLYLLGQCACGKDWLDKDKDLDFEELRSWFKLPRVLPIRGFFTPRYAPTDLLAEMSRKAGLVFDRVRIVEALRAPHVADQLAQLQPQIDTCMNIATTTSRT